MEKFRVTNAEAPAGESVDEGAQPPPPPAPSSAPSKGFLGGLFKRKNDGGGGGGGGGAPDNAEAHAAEEAALEEERTHWIVEETARQRHAVDMDERYVRRVMPERLQDDKYRAERAADLEKRLAEHDLAEQRRKFDQGDAYVPTAFRAEEEDGAPPPPPPPGGEDGSLAEILGAQTYGAGQADRYASYVPGRTARVVTYDPAADVYGGAPAGLVAARSGPGAKPGWAGIFDRHPNAGPPPPNPFSGPIVPPQYYPPASVQSRANERGIPYDVMQRLNEGRGMATLALNNHEAAPVLTAKGRREEANAAYRAADAGYRQALQLLMPARKMLEEGPDTSRVVRAREKDRLEKLINQILDRWEEVKPHLIPDVPTGSVGTRSDGGASDIDPLLQRMTLGGAKAGPGGPAFAPHAPPPAVFTATGELNLDALPSVPTHDVPLEGWSLPKTGGPKKCFVCLTPNSSKPAEYMTPCGHYLCASCSDSVFGLFNQCPKCNAPCRKDQLKAIA
jgi:hypothetical protein